MSILTVIAGGGGDYTTISGAMAAAIAFDIVEVQDASTYDEQVTLKSDVTLRAQTRLDPTITNAANPVIKFNGVNNGILDGFKIDIGGSGKAILFNATTGSDVRYCEIFNTNDRGIHFSTAKNTNVKCYNNLIRNCYAGIDTGSPSDDNAQIYNNVIKDCTQGIALNGVSTINGEVWGNTVHNCTDGIILFQNYDTWTFRNNIIAACTTALSLTGNGSGTDKNIFTFNCFEALTLTGYPGSNINSDPDFVNEAADDFTLLTTSACKDTGTDASVLYTIDFNGNSRPQGAGWDMGAYEFLAGIVIPDIIKIQTPNSRYRRYRQPGKLGAPGSGTSALIDNKAESAS
jgi:hypothetical protein